MLIPKEDRKKIHEYLFREGKRHRIPPRAARNDGEPRRRGAPTPRRPALRTTAPRKQLPPPAQLADLVIVV